VSRYIWSIVALAGVLFWLFFSYMPFPLPATAGLSSLPGWSSQLLQPLAILSLLLFVGIQLWLLFATVRLRSAFDPQRSGAEGGQRGQTFQLNFVIELFWTILPLLMTLGMAYISYQTWLSLSTP
jgi:heme/copper-type cytochrome/quinol oxidase subunit 2